MRNVFAAAVVAVALAWPVHAGATDGAWSVEALEGRVLVSQNGQWRPLRADESVATGKWLKTGDESSITLRRGETTIALEPRSMAAIAGLKGDPAATVLTQRWGGATLDVETRDRPHFRVQTPFLAAVVKGTRLDVRADRKSSTIRVEKGWVAMMDEARGLACEAWTGTSVTAGLGPKGRMRALGEGRWTKPVAVAPSMPAVAPIGRDRPVGPKWIDPSGASTAALAGTSADYDEAMSAR